MALGSKVYVAQLRNAKALNKAEIGVGMQSLTGVIAD